jgi:hypothetical protein
LVTGVVAMGTVLNRHTGSTLLLTFLLYVTFQCNEIFIEDKINLRTVAFEEGLQFTLLKDICKETEAHSQINFNYPDEQNKKDYCLVNLGKMSKGCHYSIKNEN